MRVTVKAHSDDARDLLVKGTVALAKATHNGIRVDMDYCRKQHHRLGKRVKRMRERLLSSDLGGAWQDKYGSSMNWESSEQLGDIIYNELGYEPKVFTETGKPSTSAAAIESIGLTEVKDVVDIERLSKARGTFLASIMREATEQDGDWFLHPYFGLNVAQTFRSNSRNPNFQNFPKRVPEIMKLIRGCFIPRDGQQLGEVDYSGAEIRGAYCYHQDPSMREEITNPDRDMHRDMAMESYKLTLDEIGFTDPSQAKLYKGLRHCGKNGFVFPAFYGDYHKSIANELWEFIALNQLKTAQGVPLFQHLRSKGIKNLEQFTQHIKDVEDLFWNERFPVYNRWRERWFRAYEKKGYFNTLTGFTCRGHMRRNQVINFPVQGTSFQMLLWSFIQLTDIAERQGWRTKIVGQIHDSIVFDFHPEERDHVLRTAQRVMTRDLRRHWRWINIPMEVDADIAPVNARWKDMAGYPIQ